MNLSTLPITQRAVIPESYLDEMGHMNFMWYTHLFSNAMGEVFELFGMSRDYCLANKSGAFALKQFTAYLAEVRAGETVTVRSRVLGRSVKRLHVMHFMIKENAGVLAATSEVLGTHVDMTTRRTSPWPPRLAEALDRLIAEHAVAGWVAPVCGAIAP
jgi:acyl-CoA thioester hydrolase